MLRTFYALALKSSCILAVLFFSALLCSGQTTARPPEPGSRQITLQQALSWLPDDTETVLGTNGPFPLPDLSALGGGAADQQELPSAELESRMRVLPLGLFSFKNGGLSEKLKGKAIILAVEGSRRFRPPTRLGEMLYEGCEIAVFDPAVTLDRDSFMKSVSTSALRLETIAGVRFAVFEEQQENDIWTTFVGFPRNNIVLIATNMEYLRTVLTRMQGAAGPRALPDSLPEWKYINTQAPVWGLRHYQKVEPNLDPTSPFSDGEFADPQAIGLTFWFEPSVRRMANVSYLSTNSNASQLLQGYLGVADAASASPREFQIRLRQPAPGVIEGSVTLSLTEGFSRFLFGLLAMLGHAIAV